VDGNIFNSRGALVAIVVGPAIFDPKGKKLYDLKGSNIYKLSGELVGHLASANASKKHHLDQATDKAFPGRLGGPLICRIAKPHGRLSRVRYCHRPKVALG